MNKNKSIGITHLAYKLPDSKISLEKLESDHKTSSPAKLLREFGFENCYTQNNSDDLNKLIIEAGEEILQQSKISPEEIKTLFLYSGLGEILTANPKTEEQTLKLFRYPIAEAKYKLGLLNANTIATSQQGCSGLLSTIVLASQLMESSGQEKTLCLTGDALPHDAPREIMYNIMSDAGAAILLEKNASKNKIVHFHEQHQPYYWDTPNHKDELLASYFPMAERTIANCLKEAGLSISDIKWFVPHNVSLRSWKILADLLHIPMEKIWTSNIARVGHTVSCDHIINLVDMERDKLLKKNDYLVLFTFGFGASWSCLILQH